MGTINIMAGRNPRVYRLGGVTIAPVTRQRKCNEGLVGCLVGRCSGRCARVVIKAKSIPNILTFCGDYNFRCSRYVGNFFARGCSRPVVSGKVLLGSVVCLGHGVNFWGDKGESGARVSPGFGRYFLSFFGRVNMSLRCIGGSCVKFNVMGGLFSWVSYLFICSQSVFSETVSCCCGFVFWLRERCNCTFDMYLVCCSGRW